MLLLLDRRFGREHDGKASKLIPCIGSVSTPRRHMMIK
jgi:hypothetical protein